MRFPAHLLPEVVATLAAAQEAVQATAAPTGQLGMNPGLGPMVHSPVTGGPGDALGRDTLRAAAMGAGAVRIESVAPVDKRAMAKALRWAPCVWDFYVSGWLTCLPATPEAGHAGQRVARCQGAATGALIGDPLLLFPSLKDVCVAILIPTLPLLQPTAFAVTYATASRHAR